MYLYKEGEPEYLFPYTKILARRKDMREATDEQVAAYFSTGTVPVEIEFKDELFIENGNLVETPLEDLHWRQLKKKVHEAGGAYTNKRDALEFLSQDNE